MLPYFLVTPVYTLRLDDPDGAITVLVLLLVAVAVAALVDRVAHRAAEARRPRRKPTAGFVRRFRVAGRRSDPLLDRIREAYSQRAVSIVAGAATKASEVLRRSDTRAPASTLPTPRSMSVTTSSGCCWQARH